MKSISMLRLFTLLVLVILMIMIPAGCGDDDDDDDSAPVPDDDDDVADDDDDNDTTDDDDADDDDDDNDTDDDDDDDDDDDYDPGPPPDLNPTAKEDAFKLFYKERMLRTIYVLNRFGFSGDTVFATAIGKNYIAISGNDYEVVPGPNDNNPIGRTVYDTWKLYQAFGGRELELTLIRLFEGLRFSEEVTGHPGLTNREALPGWTRIVDGINDTTTRTRFGAPIVPPVTYDALLETEIIDTFFDGLHFTYRENPEEYYFNYKAINELEQFAITFVFDHLEESPPWLHISNCCSSWMITQIGPWTGAYWGNHNSRDNFTDYALGYLAAFEAEATAGLPADLALAAQNAANSARNTGDAIVTAGMVQETVDEHSHDYNDLVPGGWMRPDGTSEWQDLGSLSSCQMVYVAQAISSGGLQSPVPELPLPGAIESSAIALLFELLGISLPVPQFTCKSIDDAFIGMGWGDIVNLELLGVSVFELFSFIETLIPGIMNDLFGSMMDDFKELILGAVNLCIYAEYTGDTALYNESHQTLRNLIELTYQLADLVYAIDKDQSLKDSVAATHGPGALASTMKSAEELYYMATIYGRMFNINTPYTDFNGFDRGLQKMAFFEAPLTWGDTSYKPLMDDTEIASKIDAKLATKEQWIIDRYNTRFGEPPSRTYPVRRAGAGYECIGPDGNWMATENDRHRWFSPADYAMEAHLCTTAVKHSLDCSWAVLGCEGADMNDDGTVDAADTTLFDAAWTAYGDGATCDSSNNHCDGADLDKSGTLDSDDQGYINVAQGCVR